jgi:hypothetical protein
MNLSKVSKKVPYKDSRMTMLAFHKNKIKEFEDEILTIPEKEALLEQYRLKLKFKKDISEIFEINKQITDLEKKIHNIKNRIDYSEYQLKAINYIDEYKNMENVNKGQISKNFLQECMSQGLLDTEGSDALYCQDCQVYRIINKKEALAICNECGTAVSYQDNEVCAEFSDEIEVLIKFNYKRGSHFKELLSMLSARESSSPPQEVIDKILEELKKNRVYDKNEITQELLRKYLKKLGLHKMYEHIPLIIHKICGTEPPKISRELENELIRKFEEIQAPFEKHKPPGRKNFLSYNYCIYKFCELLGQDHLLKNLSLLKSREKLHDQDKLFEKICNELGWKFISSV